MSLWKSVGSITLLSTLTSCGGDVAPHSAVISAPALLSAAMSSRHHRRAPARIASFTARLSPRVQIYGDLKVIASDGVDKRHLERVARIAKRLPAHILRKFSDESLTLVVFKDRNDEERTIVRKEFDLRDEDLGYNLFLGDIILYRL